MSPRTLNMQALLRRPEALWLLAAGAVLLAVLGWAGWTVVSKYQQAATRLAEIEPRHARLAGLLQNKELLAQSQQALGANLTQFVHSAEQDPSQTANTALKRVRELAAARGLRVTSSQAAAPRDEQGFDRIGLNLRVEGDWPELVALLGDLAAQRPAIYTATQQFGVARTNARNEAQVVFGQLDLYVLKERRP